MAGDWLLRIARVLFDDSIIASVIHPTIADFRQELLDAGVGTGARLLAHVHGYVAFWTIVLISPFAFRGWLGRKQHAFSMVMLTIVTAALAVVIALRTPFSETVFHWIFDKIPGGTYAALAALNSWAFLAGPLAIGFLFLRRRLSSGAGWQIRSAEVMLLSLLSLSVGAVLSTAGVIATFEPIGAQGSAGLREVSRGIRGAMSPAFYSALSGVICLAAACWFVVREQRLANAPPLTEAMSARVGLALSVLLAVSLVAIDQLVRLQHEAAFWTLKLLTWPSDIPNPGQVISGASGRTMPPLLIWGMVLSAIVLVSGLVIWRASRARQLHPLFVWTTRLGVAIALAGAVWHASAANWYANSFDDLFTRAEQAARPPR